MMEDQVRLGIAGSGGARRRHLAGLAGLASCGVPSTPWPSAIARSRTPTTWLMRRSHSSAADRRHGYAGHIVVEISLMAQRYAGYDALEAVSQSYRVLARAFREAGIARASGTRSA